MDTGRLSSPLPAHRGIASGTDPTEGDRLITHRRSPDLLFVLWTVGGAALCLGLVSILTIGVFVLPVAALLCGLLLWWGGPGRALAGALSGAAAPLFYIAWLNRGGPGEVCHAITGGLECTEEMSPWPWLVAGLVLAMAGLVLFAGLGRPRRRALR
ncbi:MAG: hypothetical protein JWO76_1131 [Nocardioides sp.]|nr:hypothetical protein [Nocardioides sp.]